MSKAKSIDIDAILADNVRKRAGGTCSLCAALAEMPADWRAKFEAAIEDRKRYSSQSLLDAFDRIGVTLARNTVDRHRRRECVGSRAGA